MKKIPALSLVVGLLLMNVLINAADAPLRLAPRLITVWFNDSGQQLGKSGSYAVALGDLDGDVDLDAFIANSAANKVWLNDGTGGFSDSGQLLGGSISTGVAVGDLDDDGDLDAFVANRGFFFGAPDKVWLNDGAGNYIASSQDLGNEVSESVALGDVDDDDDLDAFVATCGQFGDPNRLWLNDGKGNFDDSGQDFGSPCSSAIALGDLDGDDDLDAFVGNAGSSSGIEIWLNDGAGNFMRGPGADSSYNFDVALGDLDGDSDLDAVVANGAALGGNEPNKVWLNDGMGHFTDSGQRLGSSASNAVSLGDFDRDGDLDAFFGNGSLGTPQANTVHYNDGLGGLGEAAQNLGNSHTADVALGDLDGDGDLDVFAANDGFNKVWVNDPVSNRIFFAIAVR